MRRRGVPLRLVAAALGCLGIGLVPRVGLGQEAAAHGAGGQAHHANHVSLFLGATTETSEGARASNFSLGAEYERRLGRWIGLVVGAEGVFGGEEREALLGVLLNFQVTRGLVLGLGPGVEFESVRVEEQHEGAGARSEAPPSESGANAAFRMGGLYEFEVGGRATVAPTLYADVISGKKPVWVWGLSVGLGF